jgi:hypothetical protein
MECYGYIFSYMNQTILKLSFEGSRIHSKSLVDLIFNIILFKYFNLVYG